MLDKQPGTRLLGGGPHRGLGPVVADGTVLAPEDRRLIRRPLDCGTGLLDGGLKPHDTS
jgi:hypothetical protein